MHIRRSTDSAKEEINYLQLKNFEDSNQSFYEKKKTKINYFLIFTFLFFVIEIAVKNNLNSLNEYLYEEIGESLLIYINFEIMKFFLLFLIFNFVNLYAALLFVLLDSLGAYLSATLKFIPHPDSSFYTNTQIIYDEDYSLYNDVNTINNTSLVLIFATVYKSLIRDTYIDKEKLSSNKIMLISLFCIFITLLSFLKFFQNICTINEIFFETGLGIILYYLAFVIFEVNIHDHKQFYYFVRKTNNLKIIIGTTLFYFFTVIILIQTKMYLHYSQIVNISKMFLFISSLVGINLEHRFVFYKNYYYFSRYNIFSKTYREKFNDTSFGKSFLRFFIMFMIYLIFEIIESTYFGLENIYTVCLIQIFYGIFFFFIIKLIFKYMHLTNETLFRNEKFSEFLNRKDINSLELNMSSESFHLYGESLQSKSETHNKAKYLYLEDDEEVQLKYSQQYEINNNIKL